MPLIRNRLGVWVICRMKERISFPKHLKSTTIFLTAIPLSNSKKLYKVESLFWAVPCNEIIQTNNITNIFISFFINYYNFKFIMYEKAKVKVDQIPLLVQKYRGNLEFKIDTNPYFIYQKKAKNKKEKDEDVIELVKNVLNDIKLLNESEQL